MAWGHFAGELWQNKSQRETKTKQKKQKKQNTSEILLSCFLSLFCFCSLSIHIHTYIYTYIYIYAGELLVCPPFGLQRVISLAPLRVISLSTFWGGHFRTIKIGVFEDFWDDFWSKLVFFGFPVFCSLVTSF